MTNNISNISNISIKHKPYIETNIIKEDNTLKLIFETDGKQIDKISLNNKTLEEINTILLKHNNVKWNVLFWKWIQLSLLDLTLTNTIISLPSNLQCELYPHQIENISYLLSHPRAILTDEMGLGKTCTIITTMELLNYPRNLIVCPKPVKLHWAEELLKFVDQQSIIIETSKLAKERLALPNYRYFITTYKLITDLLDLFKKYKWNMIIADEGHYLKHLKSGRAKAYKELTKNSKTRLILSTATPSHETETIWSLLHICDDVIFKDFYIPYSPKVFSIPKITDEKFYFAERYTKPEVIRIKGGGFRYKCKIPKRLDELNILSKCFVHGKKIDEVMDLPPNISEVIVIGELSKLQKKQYEIKYNEIDKLKETKGKEAADVVLMELVRKTSKLKQKLALDYIYELTQSYHKKFIVFFHHIEFGNFLHEHLKLKNIKTVLIHSGINDREKQINEFKTKKDIQIGLFSLGTCSTGVNFTLCNFVVYADITFDAVILEQSEGRCRRIGQKEDHVLLYYLQLKGSTDELILQSFRNKQRTSKKILQNE